MFLLGYLQVKLIIQAGAVVSKGLAALGTEF
jgi:hypothetical protein